MKKRQLLSYAITILLIYALWYVLSLLLGSEILPDPVVVFKEGFREIREHVFWEHVGASAFRILSGLVIAFVTAVPLGLFLGSNPRLDRLFAPFIYLGYPIPKVVLMPIVFLITTRDAARTIDTEVVYSLKSLGGSRFDFYRHAVWPVSLPGIFTSLRIVTGTSVAVLFFIESIGTSKGLGFYIIDAWGRADYAVMFVGIISLSMIGIILYETFDVLERKLCIWKDA
jgi:NitT/TauT family transport system permease protein